MRGATARDTQVLWTSALIAPFTALRKLDGFEPPMLLADVDVEVTGVGRFRLRGGTDDIITILPSREPHVREVVESYLRPGDTFVDAGANLGFYSVVARARVGPEGRIFAVEMMPETAAVLREQLARNEIHNATVVQRALSDGSGAEITATAHAYKHGQASIVRQVQPEGGRIEHVRTIRLDEVLSNVEEIALIKMDLEGAEYRALRGTEGVLDRVRSIIFENNSNDTRIDDLLAAAGFRVSHLSGHDYLAVRS
jgi:FkbM family methyltransferase